MASIEKRLVNMLGTFVAACLLAVLAFAQPAFADLQVGNVDLSAQSVVRMPDVTEAMANPLYWSNKQQNPTGVLADSAAIDALNKAAFETTATRLQAMRGEQQHFYTAGEQQTVRAALEADLASFVRDGAQDIDGKALTEEEAAAIAAKCPTNGAAPTIASGYAIVVNHTTMRCLPSDRMIGLTPGDKDDDNLYLSMLRVNEPLVVRMQSTDGKYYLCTSTCLDAAWVPAEDIAICKDKDEWLKAWDIPAGQELVVTGYKVRTEQTRQAPNIANRMLYMGTVLERVDLDSPEKALEIVGTSSAYNRHVCYLPVRKSDGAYSKELALIAEADDVSEGYLPLTKENIVKQAFKSLGQMYGWGGMLEANDCSGYVRDVYKCFGLELARNTTWQMEMPVLKMNLAGMSDEDKAAAIARMPLGAVLYWGGHEMIYLGQENGKLYVISALGGIGDLYGDSSGAKQVKGVTINTLDVVRGNRDSWLSTLTCASVPYMSQDAEIPTQAAYQKTAADDVWAKGSDKGLSFTFVRAGDSTSTFGHFTGVLVDGTVISPENYTAVSGSVVIELKPAYLETLSVGTHTLEPTFDDGKAESATFTVQASDEGGESGSGSGSGEPGSGEGSGSGADGDTDSSDAGKADNAGGAGGSSDTNNPSGAADAGDQAGASNGSGAKATSAAAKPTTAAKSSTGSASSTPKAGDVVPVAAVCLVAVAGLGCALVARRMLRAGVDGR